jgi:hypothetical protein
MNCDRRLSWGAARRIGSLAGGLLICGLVFSGTGCSSDPEPSDSTTASRQPSSREQNAYDGGIGFVVPFRPDCPKVSVRMGAQPPDGYKEWCERTGRDAGVKHGWYAEWYPDGRPSVTGEYRDGLQTGVWTRWYTSGKKRVQAEFQNGLQHGRLISWSESGEKRGEQHYANGSML